MYICKGSITRTGIVKVLRVNIISVCIDKFQSRIYCSVVAAWREIVNAAPSMLIVGSRKAGGLTSFRLAFVLGDW